MTSLYSVLIHNNSTGSGCTEASPMRFSSNATAQHRVIPADVEAPHHPQPLILVLVQHTLPICAAFNINTHPQVFSSSTQQRPLRDQHTTGSIGHFISNCFHSPPDTSNDKIAAENGEKIATGEKMLSSLFGQSHALFTDATPPTRPSEYGCSSIVAGYSNQVLVGDTSTAVINGGCFSCNSVILMCSRGY